MHDDLPHQIKKDMLTPLEISDQRKTSSYKQPRPAVVQTAMAGFCLRYYFSAVYFS